MCLFERLPQQILNDIALHLDNRDLVSLCLTSHTNKNKIKSEDFWKRKTDKEFGNLFQLYSIYTKATGLELPSDLSSKFGKEPDSWREYYKQKKGHIKERDCDILKKQCDKEYYIAQENMMKFQDNVNYSTVTEMASKMLWILDIFPTYSGCYLIFASILNKMGRPDDAISVLEMGRVLDPTFKPFSETKICKTSHRNKQTQVPLLVHDNLSPELLKVLFEIFYTFDKDKDGALCPKELDHFVFSTNGQHPPISFIEQMGQRFGANEQGWLTQEGFMAFYLEQTLGDVSETQKDIRAHGYNGHTLVKI